MAEGGASGIEEIEKRKRRTEEREKKKREITIEPDKRPRGKKRLAERKLPRATTDDVRSRTHKHTNTHTHTIWSSLFFKLHGVP